MKRTICILVLYNPDFSITNKVIERIVSQVDTLYIADNSPIAVGKNIQQYPNVIYEEMEGNVGIAAAQNRGIDVAIKEGFEYVFFLDQDSICPPDIIRGLRTSYEELLNSGIIVGAVGPCVINRISGKPYRGLINNGTRINVKYTEVAQLISSATFSSVEVFRKVGGMESALFIDGVDHEWCWRASAHWGYRFFMDNTIQLSHQLGEGDRFFLFRKIAIPTPFRTYYQFRNYFILCRRGYVPLYWKISNGFKYLIKTLYYPLFVPPRKEYLKNIWKGIIAGVIYHV